MDLLLMRPIALGSLLGLLPLTALALALTPAQREQCKLQIGEMKVEHLRLSQNSQQLNHDSAHLESLERGIEAAQADIAQDRVQLQNLREALESKAGTNAAEDGVVNEFSRYAGDIHRLRQAREAFALKLHDYNERVRAQQIRRERYNRQAGLLNQSLALYEERAQEINMRCSRNPAP